MVVLSVKAVIGGISKWHRIKIGGVWGKVASMGLSVDWVVSKSQRWLARGSSSDTRIGFPESDCKMMADGVDQVE